MALPANSWRQSWQPNRSQSRDESRPLAKGLLTLLFAIILLATLSTLTACSNEPAPAKEFDPTADNPYTVDGVTFNLVRTSGSTVDTDTAGSAGDYVAQVIGVTSGETTITPTVSVDIDGNGNYTPVSVTAVGGIDYPPGTELDLSELATTTPVTASGIYVKDATGIVWYVDDNISAGAGAVTLALYSLPTTTTAPNPKIAEGLGEKMPTSLFGQETTVSAEFITNLAARDKAATDAAKTVDACAAIAKDIAGLSKWLGVDANTKSALTVTLAKASADNAAQQTALKAAEQAAAKSGDSAGDSKDNKASPGASATNAKSASGGSNSTATSAHDEAISCVTRLGKGASAMLDEINGVKTAKQAEALKARAQQGANDCATAITKYAAYFDATTQLKTIRGIYLTIIDDMQRGLNSKKYQ